MGLFSGGDEFGPQIGVDPGPDPAGADAARPRPADRSRLYRWERSQRTCLDLITVLSNPDQN